MIVFEFSYETHNADGTLKSRPVYWIGCTEVTGEDKEHEDEIIEQLDAEQVFVVNN
jgi:hypothetical protein